MPSIADRFNAAIQGRDGALVTLGEVLETARSAAAGVLISGEAGIGKTTLVNAAVGMADGFEVLRATGVPVESDMAFGGLAQLLAPLIPFSESILARQRLILESALSLSASPAHDELAVAGAVLAVLAHSADRTPLLIAIDDAQWVDPGSIKAVLFALRRMQDHPLALVIASRPLDIDDPLRAAGLREVWLSHSEPMRPAPSPAPRPADASMPPRSIELSDLPEAYRSPSWNSRGSTTWMTKRWRARMLPMRRRRDLWSGCSAGEYRACRLPPRPRPC